MVAVTSADVAREAGVSRGAVSQILNGRGQRFAESTRQRVLDTAARLEYQPSLAGRALARGTSDVVVAVVPHTTFGGHLQDMLDVMTRELTEHGWTLVTRFSADDVPAFDRFLAALQPAAVVAMAQLAPELLEVLRSRGVPVATSGAPSSSEHDQNAAVGALQAEHLIEKGYRRLVYARLADARDNVYGDSRYAGFTEACVRAGLDTPPVVDVTVDDRGAARLLRGAGAPGIAVGCYNDDVGLALVARAQEEGWDVPADVAVVGMDNSLLARALSPRLTSVSFDPVSIAQGLVGITLRTLGSTADVAVPPPAFTVVEGQTT